MQVQEVQERLDFRFPTDIKEQVLGELAQAIERASEDDAEVARLAWQASTFMKWRELQGWLTEHNTHPFSHSWLFKLAKIWEWWVVRMKYAPKEVFTLPRNKLYIAASAKEGDLGVVAANTHLSDAAFRAMFRNDTPDVVPIRISRDTYETLTRLAERLSAISHHHLNPNATAEFAIEVLNLLSDRAILEAWNAVHGEAQREGD